MRETVKCQYCGKDEALPFRCQYCQGLFCVEHRLPENHACTNYERGRAPVQEAPLEFKVTYTPPRLKRAKFWFSPTEIRHLALSALLVLSVGLSWMLFIYAYSPLTLISASFVFAWIFLLHEIAHKLVAQHYGLWAEFRLTLFGAIITLLSTLSPFKIIAPGAVMITGHATKESIGKTAVAGPSVNVVLSIVSFALTFVPPNPFFEVFVFSAALNAFIAVFNLIPVGMFDGLKVFYWNRLVWGVAFAMSAALVVMIFASFPKLLL